MYYIYILYSDAHDRYYVGQSNDVQRRLAQHNEQEKHAYTTRYRPWRLVKSYCVGESLGLARKIENHIKRLKSRKYIEYLLDQETLDSLINRYS